MMNRERFKDYLLSRRIKFTLPTSIRDDDTIYDSLHAVCEKLITSKPSLLNSDKLKNLETLMRVAGDGFFFTGPHGGQYYSQRPLIFKNAIEKLAAQNPSVLNQDTFNGLCRIATANLDQWDIDIVAQCFIKMKNSNLLTKNNIHALVENVIHAPLRFKLAQGMLMATANGGTRFTNGPDRTSPGRADTINNLLETCPRLTQADFNLAMRCKTNREIDHLAEYTRELHAKGLDTPVSRYQRQIAARQTRTGIVAALAVLLTPISLIFTLPWWFSKKHKEPIKKLTLTHDEMQAIKDKRKRWRERFINHDPSIAKKPKEPQDQKMLLKHDEKHQKYVFLVSKSTFDRYKFFGKHGRNYLDQATPAQVRKLGIKI